MRFGRLTYLEDAPSKNGKKRWVMLCDCGVTKIIPVRNLRGGTKSCGCLQREHIKKLKYSHGHNRTPTYRVWESMKQRCNNPKNKRYKDYGGRGIKICKSWDKYENFLSDMGERPSSNHSIERVNNDLGYSRSNCVWKLSKYQIRNSRAAKLTQHEVDYIRELNGSVSAKEIAIKYGVQSRSIRNIWLNKTWAD